MKLKYVFAGIPILFAAGGILHFLYAWSGRLAVIGVIAAVNESVWEHLKLSFWPLLIWWLVLYLLKAKSSSAHWTVWVTSLAVAVLVSNIFIVSFYYSYTGAFGVHSTFLSIMSLPIGTTVAQLLALHVFRRMTQGKLKGFASIIFLLLLGVSFAIFTFSHPSIPIFME